MHHITGSVFVTQEIDAEAAQFKALSKPLHVCITAAESPTCYAVLSAIASGEVFGPNTEINLRLFDTPSADFTCIQGLAMETQDLCSGLVRGIEVRASVIYFSFSDCVCTLLHCSILVCLFAAIF